MRIDHAALAAEDPAALSAWYEQWFGLQEEGRLVSPTRPPVIFLRDDAEQRLEIVPGRPSPWARENGFATHVAFSTDEIDVDMKRLQGSGIRIVEQRTTSAGWKIAYFCDPAGNLLEMVQRWTHESESGGRK